MSLDPAAAADLRTAWLKHALCTAPAERPEAEDAIAGLYALLDQPRPVFVWVGSPAAAAQILPRSPALAYDGPWPLESRLATLMSTVRKRLGSSIGADRKPMSRAVWESVAGPLRAAVPGLSGLTWYGQHDADWVAHYDVYRRVGGVRFDPADVAQLELWATLVRSCGWWWPRDDVCVVAERPVAVRTEPMSGGADGEVRLHAAAGPAVVFPDGWAVHAWHGTRVPSWAIDAPTAELIAAERNVEVRRCAIERLGWAEYIDLAGLALVATAPDPGNPARELCLYDLPYEEWGVPARLLLAVNGSAERDGTRRRYGLHVPSWFDNPIDAAGWSYGLTGTQYAKLQRRT